METDLADLVHFGEPVIAAEWGRPLVCAGRPRPAVLSKDQASAEPT